MLKLRVLTALLLGPFIIWSVLAFSHRALSIELAIIMIIGAWEWARISGLTEQRQRIGYAIIVGLILFSASFLMHKYPGLLSVVIFACVIWWCFCMLWLIQVERNGLMIRDRLSPRVRNVNLLIGIVILLGAFMAMTGLHQTEQYGAKYIFILLILIWAADSTAYFTGKAFGRHKLAPTISPGKSWEGVWGALIGTVTVSALIAWYLKFNTGEIVTFVIIALISIIFSVVGDLFESLFKRHAKIKDSSHILPGHGGILDRIDSLVAAAPVFFFGLSVAKLS